MYQYIQGQILQMFYMRLLVFELITRLYTTIHWDFLQPDKRIFQAGCLCGKYIAGVVRLSVFPGSLAADPAEIAAEQ